MKVAGGAGGGAAGACSGSWLAADIATGPEGERSEGCASGARAGCHRESASRATAQGASMPRSVSG